MLISELIEQMHASGAGIEAIILAVRAMEEAGGKRARGTRLPVDWIPPAADWKMAVDMIGPRAETELRKFVDYWLAKPGKDGTKLDWPATWRNWIRKAASDRRGHDRSTAGTILAVFAGGAGARPSEGRDAPMALPLFDR